MSPEFETDGRYEALVEGSPDALMIISEHGVISLVNAELEQIFGYSREELVGQHYGVLLPHALSDDGEPQEYQFGRNLSLLARCRSGEELTIEVRMSRLSTSPGREIAVSVRDITNRHHTDADAELRTALSLLSATLDSTADGILVVSDDGKIKESNERFSLLWGIPEELLESHDDIRLMSFVLDQLVDPVGFVAKIRALYEAPEAESFDVLKFHDGRTFERYSRPQRVGTQVVGRVWSFRDITARRRAEEHAQDALAELVKQAEHHKALAFRDPLTGLPNRALFHERLHTALSEPQSGDVHLVIVDVDDFKEVNDVFGHRSGDDLLVEVGRRLKRCVLAEDTVARLGGDEFVVLLTGGQDPVAAAGRIVSALSAPAYMDGIELRVNVSLGMSSSADGSLHASELMRQADIALHEAKAAGKNRYERFHPDMMTALLVRTDLEAGLRRAVERQEILVHFQPIVSTEDIDVCQMEVLVRWQRPTGLVAPVDFIPVAERNGSIIGVGEEVLRQASAQLSGWLEASERRSISVNVSAVQLREEHFASRVFDILAGAGVRPSQVIMEVTESVFLIPGNRVIEQLSLLRHYGVRISIDDFGTGYSSLGRLQDLPVDAIKVDKSFVDKIETGDERLPILDSMIDMAHNLGLHVTAEGVENEVQAERLIRLGSDALQGYLFSKPRPLTEVSRAEEHSTGLMRGLLRRAA